MDTATHANWGTLPPLADGFVPRPETGGALAAALVSGSVIALVPEQAGGPRSWRHTCGKTQLAIAAAQALRDSGAVERVIWLTAASRPAVLSGLVAAAGDTGSSGTGADGGVGLAADASSVAARFLGLLRDTDRPWLVVLDDLTAAVVRDKRLWPAGPAGRVLITTADPGAVTALADTRAEVIGVGPFSPREALQYLVGRLTTDLDQRQGAMDLITELRHEPLALALASAVIASSDLTGHSYREHYVKRRDQAAGVQGADELAAAAIAWELSMEHADLMSPGPAQPLLVLAALLDGNAMPAAVFSTGAARAYCLGAREAQEASGADPDKTIAEGLAFLASAGLLSVDRAPGVPPTVRMSWPVQAAVRAAMPDGMLPGAAATAASALLELWQAGRGPSGDAGEGLAAGLRSCTDSLRRAAGLQLWQGGCHPVLLRAGHSLDAATLTGPALEYWAELAAASAQALGDDHPATAGINERLAHACLADGQAPQAITLLQKMRAQRADRLGPDHPGTLELSRGLGRALTAAGRYGEAITVLTQAVEGWARSPDRGGLRGLVLREDLAAAHRAAGESKPAIALYRSTLAERERLQGPRHVDTMAARQQLAAAYLADGRLKPAVSQYERLVADRERTLGPSHLHTIAARGALGAAYHSAGRMAAAVRLSEQTRTSYTAALGPDHRDTLAACVNLAHAYYAVGRVTDASHLLAETLKRCAATLPPRDQLTLTARESLANINGTPA